MTLIKRLIKLWVKIKDKFENFPSQSRVVRKMISLGLSVRRDFEGTGRIFCGDIEIKPNSLARSSGVDRRVVLEVVRKIMDDEVLSSFFEGLMPTASFGSSATIMGFSVIELVPESAQKPGIISDFLSVISKKGINIRQVIADDPDLVDEPRATIVTETPIPNELIGELKKVKGVKALVLL